MWWRPAAHSHWNSLHPNSILLLPGGRDNTSGLSWGQIFLRPSSQEHWYHLDWCAAGMRVWCIRWGMYYVYIHIHISVCVCVCISAPLSWHLVSSPVFFKWGIRPANCLDNPHVAIQKNTTAEFIDATWLTLSIQWWCSMERISPYFRELSIEQERESGIHVSLDETFTSWEKISIKDAFP